MKKSKGTQSRIFAMNPPSLGGGHEVKKKIIRPYKKKSKKFVILILILILLSTALSVIFLKSLNKNRVIDSSLHKNAGPDIGEGRKDNSSGQAANDGRMPYKGTALKKKGSLSSGRDAGPEEKKIYDFGTTLKLDPPPVRD
jgi:hypothetical protein